MGVFAGQLPHFRYAYCSQISFISLMAPIILYKFYSIYRLAAFSKCTYYIPCMHTFLWNGIFIKSVKYFLLASLELVILYSSLWAYNCHLKAYKIALFF